MSSDSKFHGVFSSLLSPQTKKERGHGQSTITPIRELDEESDGEMPVEQSQVGQIAVDIYEEGDYLIVKAPIAGVRLADLDIDVVGNTITIRGERAQRDDIPSDKYYVQECYWGTFQRSITLPFAANPAKVKATFDKNNILKIFVSKEKKVKIVRISEGS